nr:hypothetical protein [Methylobacterium sp. ZNC0032]
MATLLGGIAALIVLIVLIWLLFRIAKKIGKDFSLTSLDVVLIALGGFPIRNTRSLREKSRMLDSVKEHRHYPMLLGSYALIGFHMLTWIFIFI